MSTIAIHQPDFLRYFHHRTRSRRKFHKISATWSMTLDSQSSQTRKKEEVAVELHQQAVPQLRPSNLEFDRKQPSDQEFIQEKRFEFGRFVAREAILDEEYWTAAWLRAETHWEDRPSERYVDNYKRKFAEQEFNALKRRCKGLNGQKCTCILAVKKEEKNIKRTVLKSVVGTLDLSVRHLLYGETFPGERVIAPVFCGINRTSQNLYAYVSNLCVAKSARRQGIATNMLHFALLSAKSDGLEQIFVHVDRNNKAAQQLYKKMGFEIVEEASFQLSEEQTFLLGFKT